MKKTKQKTEGKNMRIERFKGKLIEEDKKENNLIDIICSFNDLQMKTAGEESKSGLNEKDLNVYMYGNNISTHALNKFFLTCRTQVCILHSFYHFIIYIFTYQSVQNIN